MSKLLLLRHLKSRWNEENRFTGWTDVSLSEEGLQKAGEMAEKIFKFEIDKVYTSPLFRNMDTVARILGQAGKYPVFSHLDKGKMKERGNHVDIGGLGVSVFVSEKLNERYYGKLQGENKDEIKNKYGQELVRLWRRSYNVPPPGGESLKDVVKRTSPFFIKYAERDLKSGKNVLVVASHNSLRAVVKYVEKISDREIINLEIPYGGLVVYDFGPEVGIYTRQNV